MRRSVLAILWVTTALLAACGSEPASVVAGDDVADAVTGVGEFDDAGETDLGTSGVSGEGASVSRDATPTVAEDSAPRLDPFDFCAIDPSGGPLDALDVLIEVPGGRWGDEPVDVDTGRAVSSIDPSPPARAPCRHDEVAQDCAALLMFLGDVGGDARASVSDPEREHELDVFASDVGDEALSYAATYRNLHNLCPKVGIEGDTFTISQLASLEVEALRIEIEAEGDTLWLATMARDNVLSVVMVLADGDDPLRHSDLADFERLVARAQARLDGAKAN